jgi:selenocysteine lyase/cysteine desulfurase
MANFATIPMLKESLAQVLDWGVEEIQSYCTSLTAPLAASATERGWSVEDRCGRAGHILGLRMPAGTDFGALKQALSVSGVSVSLRGTSVRISPHVYNDAGDIAALLEVLDRVLVAVA